MRSFLLPLLFLTITCDTVFAEDVDSGSEALSSSLLDEFLTDPVFQSLEQSEPASRAVPDSLTGDIALFVRDEITEVYSSGNLVENVVQRIGSTGVVTSIESESVRFTPAGRPELTCPRREDGWFGPCRID